MTVDVAFAKALPKVELHAHLTGSISPTCLHEIWQQRRSTSSAQNLEDPAIALKPEGAYHDILTFFKIFDTYIYNLVNDVEAVAFATSDLLKEFEDDGVRYLELRTTPRESLATGMTKDLYISTILDAIGRHGKDLMSTNLILSIDRRNTLEQAMAVVDLAAKYRDRGVVGVDLCGNPLKGDVATFESAFQLARAHGLKVTLHFAEMLQSSTDRELRTLLSYQPDRIGHVIHVPPEFEAELERRGIGLELCLSCNVHAKMLPDAGGFAEHHFGKWYERAVPIALSTDDVGVFGSCLSNEYLLAAAHFSLSHAELIQLSRRAVPSIFGSSAEKHRINALLDDFEASNQ